MINPTTLHAPHAVENCQRRSRGQAIRKGSSDGGNLNFGKNRYIFAGAGAVLGGLLGVGIAGVTTALVGAALGGLLGYNLLKRI